MSDFVLFTKPRKFEGSFEFLDILKGYQSILFSIPCKFWDKIAPKQKMSTSMLEILDPV